MYWVDDAQLAGAAGATVHGETRAEVACHHTASRIAHHSTICTMRVISDLANNTADAPSTGSG
jgi:hypothetical protein